MVKLSAPDGAALGLLIEWWKRQPNREEAWATLVEQLTTGGAATRNIRMLFDANGANLFAQLEDLQKSLQSQVLEAESSNEGKESLIDKLANIFAWSSYRGSHLGPKDVMSIRRALLRQDEREKLIHAAKGDVCCYHCKRKFLQGEPVVFRTDDVNPEDKHDKRPTLYCLNCMSPTAIGCVKKNCQEIKYFPTKLLNLLRFNCGQHQPKQKKVAQAAAAVAPAVAPQGRGGAIIQDILQLPQWAFLGMENVVARPPQEWDDPVGDGFVLGANEQELNAAAAREPLRVRAERERAANRARILNRINGDR